MAPTVASTMKMPTRKERIRVNRVIIWLFVAMLGWSDLVIMSLGVSLDRI